MSCKSELLSVRQLVFENTSEDGKPAFSEKTVSRWIARGQLRSVKLGKLRLIKRPDWEEFVNQNCVDALEREKETKALAANILKAAKQGKRR
jgi:excisionase family DNA binding protein